MFKVSTRSTKNVPTVKPGPRGSRLTAAELEFRTRTIIKAAEKLPPDGSKCAVVIVDQDEPMPQAGRHLRRALDEFGTRRYSVKHTTDGRLRVTPRAMRAA